MIGIRSGTMPISNQQDARDLGEHVRRVFATSQSERQNAIRALFVEELNFNPASGQVNPTVPVNGDGHCEDDAEPQPTVL